MDNTLILDLYMFLTATYGGLIAGFIYDVYRSIRYISRPSKYVAYIQDFLFWTVVVILFFYILIKINWGELRGFIVIGFFLGITIYMKIFSRFLYPICVKILKLISKFISLIFSPFRFVKKQTAPTITKVRKVNKEIIREIKKYKKIISTKK